VKDAIDDSSISVLSYVTGLGGRDIRKSDIHAIAKACSEGKGDMFHGIKEEIL
jgi:pyruvate ferredoxin oxidoreductase alpha subunit